MRKFKMYGGTFRSLLYGINSGPLLDGLSQTQSFRYKLPHKNDNSYTKTKKSVKGVGPYQF